ncbi:PaaI family thioesterase [Falsiroseomonas tokyonensis]|uniref:PaaI family thioesterase n=1 Tax=Falsiroseomonas tokyonensis TaxID=430521 RepID=A0ABV7BRA6_9PROT|nr:PaaI family thioesterase [Falsiroseomonas tokyonensis]MBU8537765.1 PaaI family thioesterase [Falsiroseomonas tokyonensis]
MSIAAMQARVREGVPLAGAWGIEVLSYGEGLATLRLPAREDMLRPGGTVSGPALMGLADVAMWVALLSLSEGRDESLTASLAITFLRRPPATAVLAEARVIKRGRTLSYGEVTLRAEGAAEPCAHVTTSWAATGSK